MVDLKVKRMGNSVGIVVDVRVPEQQESTDWISEAPVRTSDVEDG